MKPDNKDIKKNNDNNIYKILSHNVKETEAAGMLLASKLKKDDFVAMYGDLGVGKTAFVRGMAAVLVPEASVCSPTYTVVNEYDNGKNKLCHFDVYRIDSEDDLESIGFYDYKNCVIAIEWSEKIPFALPDSYYKVKIDRVSEDCRMIYIEFVSRQKGTVTQ